MENSPSNSATGGSVASGGYDLQARVIAYVAVHALAQRPLGWREVERPDIPLAVSAETGGPGDDIKVELGDGIPDLEVQVKRGLRADARLRDAITRFATGLSNDETVDGILVVDGTASRNIVQQLAPDLRRIRQGRRDGLHPITNDAPAQLAEVVGERKYELASRIGIIETLFQGDDSPHERVALELLAGMLETPSQAAAAWSVLVEEGLRLCMERGRRDAGGLVRLLGSRSIRLANS